MNSGLNGSSRAATYTLLVSALVFLTACSRSQTLPDFGQVPHFVLTDSNGRVFDSHVLDGKIWVADFFFTTCLGPCPRMTSRMHWVSQQVAGVPDTRFVSFTVDPEHDTPPVLSDYAGRFRADPARWFFLTGTQSVLQKLDYDTFHLGSIDGTLMHSTRFVLVDRSGRIRGYYLTDEDDGLKPLIPAIRQLAKEQPSLPGSSAVGGNLKQSSSRAKPAHSLDALRQLPAINATMNAIAAVLLIWGYTLIRRGYKRTHKRVMIAAFVTSCLFLAGYLVYHALFGVKYFPRAGAIRVLYLSILATHTLLAAAVPVLAIITLTFALRGRFDRHRALARWTLPVWLYVSVTGVVVYWMLYRM